MNRAKQLRLDRRYGVLDASVKARISSKTLHKIERGEDVAASALARLADFYEVSPSELLMPAIVPEEKAA